MIGTRRASLSLAAISVAALAACSGNGQSSGGSPRALPPVASPTSSSIPQEQQAAAVSLHLVIPGGASQTAAARHRAYVSTATNSLTFAQDGGSAQTISLAAGSPNCSTSSGNRVCSVNLTAFAGQNQTFLLKLFASATGTGTPLSEQSIVATIVAGQNNPIAVTLDGVVSSISVKLANPSLQYGESASTSVVVNALDASGNTIAGPGVYVDSNGNPLTIELSDSDTTASTALGQASVTQPTTIPLTYNGGGVTSVVIGATAGSLSNSATLLLLCGKAAAANALYVGGVLYDGYDNAAAQRLDVPRAVATASAVPYLTGYGEFPLTESGTDVTPADQVDTQDGFGIAVDNRGYAYVSAYASPGPYVAQYCPSASGAATPYRSYLLPTPAPSSEAYAYATDITIDKNDNLFELLEGSSDSIVEFAPDSGSIGNPTAPVPSPTATIAGTSTQLLSPEHITSDSAATLYVGNEGQITEYPHGSSGNVAPSKTITDTQGGLLEVDLATSDASGNVYAVYDYDNLSELPAASPFGAVAVVEYAHGDYSTPSRVISGAATDLGTYLGSTNTYGFVSGMTVDSSGDIFILDDSFVDSGNSETSYNAVEEFTSAQTGNVAPAENFAVTGVYLEGIAVSAGGQLALADGDGYGLLLYSTSGTYQGQIGVSADVGLITSVAYDTSGDLYATSFNYKATNGNTYGTSGLLTFTAPITAGATPTTVDPEQNYYEALAVDSTHDIYANSGGSVDVYAAGDTSGTPARSFGDNSRDSYTVGLGLDGLGNAYLGIEGQSAIGVFPAGSSSTIAPTASYQDISASTLDSAVAVDASGTVFVAACDTNSIAIYSPAQSTGAPEHDIIGSNTQLECPESIALDAADNIYVANEGLVLVFAAGSYGNVAPAQSFSGPSTADFDGVAIGLGFGTENPMVKMRTHEKPGRYSLSLEPASPARKVREQPTCTMSRAMGAGDRLASGHPARTGFVSYGLCPIDRARNARLARSRSARRGIRVKA